METYDRLLPLFWNKKWLAHYLRSVGEGGGWGQNLKKYKESQDITWGQRKLGISNELYTADRSSSTMLIAEETKALWLSKATSVL